MPGSVERRWTCEGNASSPFLNAAGWIGRDGLKRGIYDLWSAVRVSYISAEFTPIGTPGAVIARLARKLSSKAESLKDKVRHSSILSEFVTPTSGEKASSSAQGGRYDAL